MHSCGQNKDWKSPSAPTHELVCRLGQPVPGRLKGVLRTLRRNGGVRLGRDFVSEEKGKKRRHFSSSLGRGEEKEREDSFGWRVGQQIGGKAHKTRAAWGGGATT